MAINIQPEKTQSSGSSGSSGSSESSSKTGMITVIVYLVIAFITFLVYVSCGVKSGNIGQVFAGIFFSLLWPIFIIYVIVRKVTDANYRFCGKSLSSVQRLPSSRR